MSKPKDWAQRGWRGMMMQAAERESQEWLYLALNMLPLYPGRPGPYIQRPSMTRQSATIFGSSLSVSGSIGATTGSAPINWSFDPIGLTIYVGLPLSPVLAVPQATFLAAGVASNSTQQVLWHEYLGGVVFTDGQQQPFYWDGATGIQKLTAAPVAYGPPAVYYGKLFFIRADNQRTISWSEEAQPNVGYASLDNEWELVQSASAPLCVLVGTNEALYYWRSRGIGKITGAVTADFQASGTHDSISETLGVPLSPVQQRYVAIGAGGTFFFRSADNRFYFLRAGEEPTAIVMPPFETETGRASPFDVTTYVAPIWAVGTSVYALPPFGSLDYPTTWFQLVDQTQGTSYYVVHGRTGQPLGFCAFANAVPPLDVLLGASSDCFVGGVASDGRCYAMQGVTSTGDWNTAGGTPGTTYALLFPPMEAPPGFAAEFDLLSLTRRATANITASGGTATLLLLSSERASYPTAPTQTVPLPATTVNDQVTVGINESGRWLRVGLVVAGGQPRTQIIEELAASGRIVSYKSVGAL